jgi:NADPH-dependent curcumin reductase CurA
MRKFLGFVALATCVSAPAAASVTYDFAGVLDSSFGAYSAGDTFAGSFTYDETAAANAGSSSVTAVFNALEALNVTVNTTSGPSALTAYNGELQMGNQGTNGVDTEATDRFAVVSLVTGSTIVDTTPVGFILRLDDSTGALF